MASASALSSGPVSEPRPASPIYSSPVDCRGRPEEGYYIDARNGRREHIYESLNLDLESAKMVGQASSKFVRNSNRVTLSSNKSSNGFEDSFKSGGNKPPLPGSCTLKVRKPLSERSNRPLSNIFSNKSDAEDKADNRLNRRTVYFADDDFVTSSAVMTSSTGPRSSSCDREVPRKSRKDLFLFWKSRNKSSSKDKSKKQIC